jgi:hypothetical protein
MQAGTFASGGRRGQSISLNHQLIAIFALGEYYYSRIRNLQELQPP